MKRFIVNYNTNLRIAIALGGGMSASFVALILAPVWWSILLGAIGGTTAGWFLTKTEGEVELEKEE